MQLGDLFRAPRQFAPTISQILVPASQVRSEAVNLQFTRRDLANRVDRVGRKGVGAKQTHVVRLT